MKISAVTASRNSRADLLNRTLQALAEQTLSKNDWESIVTDNASRQPLSARTDLCFPSNIRIVRNDVPEHEASLVDARCRGISESQVA